MSKDDGTPKLLIEAQSLFGGNKTEVVQVDSNDLDPIAVALVWSWSKISVSCSRQV